jgi:hypothetical protein
MGNVEKYGYIYRLFLKFGYINKINSITTYENLVTQDDTKKTGECYKPE